MDRDIARLNIEHFREKLAEETDPNRKETIRRLLAEKEAKLEALSVRPNDRSEKR
jgi:hypothetical protein